jgi:hypothetical protein
MADTIAIAGEIIKSARSHADVRNTYIDYGDQTFDILF